MRKGHPDKLCDQISDAVLDACLAQDADSKVACETCTKTNMVMVFSEITTKQDQCYPSRLHKWIRCAGALEELSELKEAREAGMAFIMGHTHVRAKSGSGLIKRLVIDVGYDFLKRNSRGPAAYALSIPHASTLEYHPDVYKGSNCGVQFHRINEAYDEFVRDFVPSALAFLMNGEPEIVKHFLLKTLYLQGWEKRINRFKLGEGAMPASFKVLHDPFRKTDTLIADFGESAIGRVALVDSGFWWIILLRCK